MGPGVLERERRIPLLTPGTNTATTSNAPMRIQKSRGQWQQYW